MTDTTTFLSLLHDGVFEIRAPKTRQHANSTYTSTVSGYFTTQAIDTAATQIALLDADGNSPGIYTTLNPVSPDLLARAANRLATKATVTTTDADIVRRRWMLVDVDPIRPAGVSATDAELAAALEHAAGVRDYLAAEGWPAPLEVESGNGAHLLYRVDLPRDDGGLIQRVLATLAERFDDGIVSVDKSVFNPARIVKVAGTTARKGDDLRGIEGVEDRPHRMSRITIVPDNIASAIVAVSQLAAIAGPPTQQSPDASRTPPPAWRHDAAQHDRFPTTADGVRQWLESHGVPVTGAKPNGTKTMLLLERCPINPEIVSTGTSDIAVLVGNDGKLAYCNLHNRGSGYTWHDLRRAVDPTYLGPVDERPENLGGVDLSRFLAGNATAVASVSSVSADEPIPPTQLATSPTIPPELLHVPGFVGQVMAHCLDTAPYPNPAMAFCGALSLQAFLAGRKVRDSGDNRTNIYLLGLAYSAAGKDWPRRLNTRILHDIGLSDALGDRLASGEGLQDALMASPAMLCQTDEIDGMLLSINSARDARHESIMGTMLTLYSSAATVYPMRRRAGKDASGSIDQPCLVMLGTAIPTHYYAALSARMLTNGFFARTIVVEGGPRGLGREPVITDVPEPIMRTARWWAEQKPGGNLAAMHPVARIIDYSPEARRCLIDARREAEAEYARSEAAQDAVGCTVWGRVSEHVRKLALIHSVSEYCASGEIDVEAVQWATAFVMHMTRRQLAMSAAHVAEGDYDADCLRLAQKLRETPNGRLGHSVLLKRMKLSARDFRDLLTTMMERGDVGIVTEPTTGRTRTEYELLANHS